MAAPPSCSEDMQSALCLRVLSDIGYSTEWGRLDKTCHPFQSTLGPRDIRVTTRYDRSNALSSLFTALHEVGHALYEAGLPKRWCGTALGSPASLGVHESQSRFWENIIGRSRPFAVYLYNVLGQLMPDLQRQTSADQLWASANRVQPSLIRVEADEVTYSLHIIIRMLLEEQLISGELEVAELPESWDALYERYLGIRSQTYQNGLLQDVHWFSGLVGYFPTYALGNIFSACLLERLDAVLPNLNETIARGQFTQIQHWLDTNISAHGKRFSGSKLIEQAIGRPVSAEPFLAYIRGKFEVQ